MSNFSSRLMLVALGAALILIGSKTFAQDASTPQSGTQFDPRPRAVPANPPLSVRRAQNVLPAIQPGPKQAKSKTTAGTLEGWDAFVVATGDDNPAIQSGTIAPLLAAKAKTRGAGVKAISGQKQLPETMLTTGAIQNGAETQPVDHASPEVASSSSPAITGEGRQYCSGIVDAAADARFAWQKKTIDELSKDLEGRLRRLEDKTNEYKTWLARRDEFVHRATDGLVKIYARMKADAAAAELTQLDEETAASVISKLDPKISSGILSEMDPTRAARLTSIIAGAARVEAEGRKS